MIRGGRSRSWILRLSAVVLAAAAFSACRQDMHDQPKYEAFESSAFFANHSASRIPPQGTVAQGHLNADELLYEGRVGGQTSPVFPYPVTRQALERGQQRYDIYCSPCHGRSGSGDGVIVSRGMVQPPSLHIVRLREAPPGHFYDVITNGFGRMFSYSSRISPEDRWAIVAYIRALQLSQNATAADVTAQDLKSLEEIGQ